MPMKKVPAAPPGGDEQVEEGGLGGAAGAQGVGFGVAEVSGEKGFGEEEEDGDTDGKADVGLGDGIAEAGQHDDQQARHDAAAIEAGKLEREDEGEEIDGEGQHPEQGDSGDVDGKVRGDGAQLHGCGHGKQEPEPSAAG